MSGTNGALRILHVSEVRWGGVVTLLRHFADEQRRTGHDVRLLAPPGHPDLDGVPSVQWSLDRAKPFTFLPAVHQMRQVVRQLRPDVVHLHSFFAGALGRAPMGLSGLDGVPVVYQPHAWATDLYDSALAAKAVALIERRASRRTQVLVTNCQDEIDKGRSFGVDLPSAELGVAVDLTKFRPPDPSARQRARAELDVDERAVLLVLGRLARQKGQDLLVRQWEATPIPGAQLFLVGPGDASELARVAPNEWGRSIHAVGEPPDVEKWLQAADLLLLPSRYETVGLVVAEAMATGLPVIATSVDGARATIEDPATHGQTGLEPAGAVVPLGDMAALLDEARHRLEDADLRAREARRARERAEHLFRPDLVADRLEAAYRQAIRGIKKELVR